VVGRRLVPRGPGGQHLHRLADGRFPPPDPLLPDQHRHHPAPEVQRVVGELLPEAQDRRLGVRGNGQGPGIRRRPGGPDLQDQVIGSGLAGTDLVPEALAGGSGLPGSSLENQVGTFLADPGRGPRPAGPRDLLPGIEGPLEFLHLQTAPKGLQAPGTRQREDPPVRFPKMGHLQVPVGQDRHPEVPGRVRPGRRGPPGRRHVAEIAGQGDLGDVRTLLEIPGTRRRRAASRQKPEQAEQPPDPFPIHPRPPGTGYITGGRRSARRARIPGEPAATGVAGP